MSKKLESGKVKNEQRTSRKIKKKDGSVLLEEIVKDKDTGKITKHTIDGKSVMKKPKQEVVQITNENAALLTAKFLNMLLQQNLKQLQLSEKINMQLTEMNYYMSYLEPEAKRSKDNAELIKYFEQKGYQINRKA
ncbi:MAG: hypothetical protein GY817_01205 [bacterium]|nr:hypothetical protein [bacterium]